MRIFTKVDSFDYCPGQYNTVQYSQCQVEKPSKHRNFIGIGPPPGKQDDDGSSSFLVVIKTRAPFTYEYALFHNPGLQTGRLGFCYIILSINIDNLQPEVALFRPLLSRLTDHPL
jgi:hypothetical protein